MSARAQQQALPVIGLLSSGSAETSRAPFGPGIASMIAYLHGCQMVGFKRLTEVCQGLFGLTISQGAIKELAPRVTRMAYLFHPEIGPFYSLLLESVEATAGSLGVETTAAPVRALGDIERALSAIAAQPNSGIIVQPDGYTLSNRRFIIELAARHRLPTIHDRRIEAAEGGLASYGADLLDLYRRCAAYVDRVLKGSCRPAGQPLKYELVVNLKTAKALGLTIAETLLATADEVIQ
jgi:putative ABC transport system substrate-binding protein